jgi:hypothetical protein
MPNVVAGLTHTFVLPYILRLFISLKNSVPFPFNSPLTDTINYPAPNYNLVYEVIATISSPTVANSLTITFQIGNFGNLTILSGYNISINTSRNVRFVVRYQMQNVHDLYGSVAIFNEPTNTLIHEVPFTFIGSNLFNKYTISNSRTNIIVNNAGNNATITNVQLIQPYLQAQ